MSRSLVEAVQTVMFLVVGFELGKEKLKLSVRIQKRKTILQQQRKERKLKKFTDLIIEAKQ